MDNQHPNHSRELHEDESKRTSRLKTFWFLHGFALAILLNNVYFGTMVSSDFMLMVIQDGANSMDSGSNNTPTTPKTKLSTEMNSSFLEPVEQGLKSAFDDAVVNHPLFPLGDSDTEAWIRDISNPLSCGKSKCAFRSEKGPDVYGYLVTQSINDIEMHAFELAQSLTKNFGIRQLNAAPPRSIPCTASLAITLAANLTEAIKAPIAPGKDRQFRKSLHDYWNCQSVPESKLYLQPILLAPRDSLEFKPGSTGNRKEQDRNMKAYMGKLEEFATGSITRTMAKDELSRIEKQLASDSEALNQMVQHTSCLCNDFQILIDPWTGKIYHMDFDRCWQFAPYPKEVNYMRKRISEKLKEFNQKLIEYHREPPILKITTTTVSQERK